MEFVNLAVYIIFWFRDQ